LHDEGAAYQHDGGVNDRPDFTISGVRVGHKNCTIHVPLKPRHHVTINEEFLDDDADVWVFTAYEVEAQRELIVGVIGRVEFKELSWPSRRNGVRCRRNTPARPSRRAAVPHRRCCSRWTTIVFEVCSA
jgi:hypothetical protein